MTKFELVEALHKKLGFTRREAHGLIEVFFATIKDELVRAGLVKLSRFGNFTVREKKPRTGRNPQTGKPIRIDERKVLVFKPSRMLRAALDAKLSDKN